MRRTQKIIAVFVALIMLAALTAACGQTKNAEQSKAEENQQTTSKAQTITEKKLEPETLIWYFYGAKPKNADSVIATANELTKAKINAEVDYRFISPGDFGQKMQLVVASGEAFDITWDAQWAAGFTFLDNISKGAFLPLDDYLAKYPELKNVVPEKVWDGVKFNGKIYGIPNNQIMAFSDSIWVKKDIVDKYNINLDNVKSYSDLAPVLQTVKDKEPGMIPLKWGFSIATANAASDLGVIPQVENFVIDTNTWKVGSYIYLYDSVKEGTKLMRDWHEKGFFPSNVATAAEGDLALTKSGKVFSEYTTYKPGVEAELSSKFGFDVIVKTIGKPVISKKSVIATLNCISKTSKDPERAAMLLAQMNTDKDLFNTMAFGIDGQDYKKTGENRIESIKDAYNFNAWELGNVFNSYILPGQSDDVWTQTKKINEEANVDPLVSFSFDRTPVQNELAQINAVFTDFNAILKDGLDDPAKIEAQMQDKLKAAGEDRVKAEIQKQLDVWRKTQK